MGVALQPVDVGGVEGDDEGLVLRLEFGRRAVAGGKGDGARPSPAVPSPSTSMRIRPVASGSLTGCSPTWQASRRPHRDHAALPGATDINCLAPPVITSTSTATAQQARRA